MNAGDVTTIDDAVVYWTQERHMAQGHYLRDQQQKGGFANAQYWYGYFVAADIVLKTLQQVVSAQEEESIQAAYGIERAVNV